MLRTLNHQDGRPRTPQARVLSSNKLAGGGVAGQPGVGGGSWGGPQGAGLQPRPIVLPESCSGREADGWGGSRCRAEDGGLAALVREGQPLRPGCEGTSRAWGGREVRWTTWPQILHKVSGHRVEAGGGRGALSRWVEGGVATRFPSPALQAAI